MTQNFQGGEHRGILTYRVGAGSMATVFQTEGWFCVNVRDLEAVNYRKIGGSRYRFCTRLEDVISFVPYTKEVAQ